MRIIKVEQSKPQWKSIWWPDSDEEEHEENAAEQIERMGVEKGDEDEESIWWHGSDDNGEKPNEENAADKIEEKINMEKGCEDHEVEG